MAKQFIAGNIYVFTKKKYVNFMGKKRYKEISKSWVDKMNGRIVTDIANERVGFVNLNFIHVSWCKCIKTKK